MKFATIAAIAVSASALNVEGDLDMPTEAEFAQMTEAEKFGWFGAALKAGRLIARYGPRAYKYASKGSALYNAICKHIDCPF